ncbi:Uncharacterised protein [Klebsiella quasipneumoniae]|nr:Uncharacterised protein [Klebsiella quasipneumoniae]
MLGVMLHQPWGMHGVPVIRMFDLLIVLKGLAKKAIFVFDAMPGRCNVKGGHRVDKASG